MSEKYKDKVQQGHCWKKKYRYIPWCVCIHCGLIQLNNEATRNTKCE